MPGTLEKPPVVAGGGRSYWLPRHRRSVGVARGLLREFLADLPGGEPYAWGGELVLSELLGNAVLHGRTSPGRLVFVRFGLSPGGLRVEVHDAGAGRPVVRGAGADEERGRGLWLVEQLSSHWGCGPRPHGVGKAVWAVIAPEGGTA
ncbi:ATP-binding protein [Kitasatospora sp. NPDC057198]|uniref:ATP-binding protein n=1 Tax=Kitasatospora sp. NPDC057198 TaxID=3346046 RepID=UPI003643DF53